MFDSILCVDDDPITLMLCKMVIIKTAFATNISTAKNGEEALAHIDSLMINNAINKPQLLFLDLNMPVMDGWEFLERFNTNKYVEYHDTKIIILSSTIDPEDLAKSKKYPMVVDFLSKPITKEMLEYLRGKFEGIK